MTTSRPRPPSARLPRPRMAPGRLWRWIRGLKPYAARLFAQGRIAVLLLPALTAFSVSVVAFLPEPIVDRIVLDDTSRRAELWKRRVLSMLDNGANTFVMPAENGVTAAPALSVPGGDNLMTLTRTSDIYRLKLFNRSGRIIWSSRPDEIGKMTAQDHFSTTVAQGLRYATLDRKPPSEIDVLDLHAGPLTPMGERIVAEIYSPVTARGRFAGAVEFYSDVTEIHATLLTRVRLLLLAICASGLGIAGIGILLLTRGSRQRIAELRERAEKDSESMASQVQLAREVQLLGELNEWLQSAATLDELFTMVSRFMTHLFAVSEGAIYVYSNSRDVLDGWVAWNGGKVHDHIRPDACWGLRRGRTYVYGVNEVNFACEHTEPHDGRPYFCFPILAHGETVGLMHLRAAPGETATRFRACQKLAQMAAEQISMAIANVKMRDQLREQSVRDPLTGLFNRRHMTEVMRNFVQKAGRGDTTLSILSIDVDHFKLFNDNHGHDAGDIVLRSVAELLEQSVRGDDIACRPGGEEFAVILPGVTGDQALARAEALRAGIEALRVHYAGKDLPRITISIGVAHCPQHGQTVQDLLRAADEALYDAKARGRNMVCEVGQSRAEAEIAIEAANAGAQPPVANGRSAATAAE